jgi:hypothetical protein
MAVAPALRSAQGARICTQLKFCTVTAKTRAIPSLHRDSFAAKVPGPCPVLASGNMPSLQAGSSLKLPNGQFIHARPSILPGR